MQQEVEYRLSSSLSHFLSGFGFTLKNGVAVRRVNNVFHLAEFSVSKGTSNSEHGFRISLIAKIWFPELCSKRTEITQFPNDVTDYALGGKVSPNRVNGNFFVDLESFEEVEPVFSRFSQLIEKMLLPWFAWFSSQDKVLQSSESSIKRLSINRDVNKKFTKEITELYKAFADRYELIDWNCDKYSVLNEDRLSSIGEQFVEPIVSTHGFFRASYPRNPVIFQREYLGFTQAITFEMQSDLFIRCWTHIYHPNLLPESYRDNFETQYGVPPLVSECIEDESIFIADIETSHVTQQHLSNLVNQAVKELNALSVDHIRDRICKKLVNGHYGLSLEEIINGLPTS